MVANHSDYDVRIAYCKLTYTLCRNCTKCVNKMILFVSSTDFSLACDSLYAKLSVLLTFDDEHQSDYKYNNCKRNAIGNKQ
jgi:hypothetical protein